MIKIKIKFLTINFGGKKLPYILVLRLRVNDVGKLRTSSMLRRIIWRTTFVPGLISDSHSYELQNFLKFNDQLLQSAVWTVNFKNSYLPVCAHSRISSGTKVDQLEELYKILWKTQTLTHITLVNIVRVYRVTFLVKNNFKRSLVIFTLFYYSRSTK